MHRFSARFLAAAFAWAVLPLPADGAAAVRSAAVVVEVPEVEVDAPDAEATSVDADADAATPPDWDHLLRVRPLNDRAGFSGRDADSSAAVAEAFRDATAAVTPRAVPWAVRWLAEAAADPANCDVRVTTAVLQLFTALPVAEAAPRLAAMVRTLPTRAAEGDRMARDRLRLRDHAAMALATAAAAGGGEPELAELEAVCLDLSLTGHARAAAAAALADRGRDAGRVALIRGYEEYLGLLRSGKSRSQSARDFLGRSADAELVRRVEAVAAGIPEEERTARNNASTLLDRMRVARAPLEDLRAWAVDPAWKQAGRRYEAVETLGDRGEPADVPLVLALEPWDTGRGSDDLQQRQIRRHGVEAAQRIRQRLWRDVALGLQLRGELGAGPSIRVPADEPEFPDAFLDGPDEEALALLR